MAHAKASSLDLLELARRTPDAQFNARKLRDLANGGAHDRIWEVQLARAIETGESGAQRLTELGVAEVAFSRLQAEGCVRPVQLCDARHIHATTLLTGGGNVRAVAARLCHDPAALMSVYAHVIAGADAELAALESNAAGQNSVTASATPAETA